MTAFFMLWGGESIAMSVKLGVERKSLDPGSGLASAPTFSRLENAAMARDLYRMVRGLC